MLVLVNTGPAVLSLHHHTDDWSCSGPVSHGRGHSTTTTTSSGLAILASPVPIVITLQSQDTGQENINQKKHLGTDDSISQQNCKFSWKMIFKEAEDEAKIIQFDLRIIATK